MAIATKDSLLTGYASNWSTRIAASPSDWNLQSSDATAITAAVTPFVNAYNAILQARESGIRSSELARNKDDAKSAMLTVLRPYYNRIQFDPAVTDGNKELLGITVRKQPTPIPAPTLQPTCDIKGVVGYTVSLHVHSDDENRKGLPDGVHGIMVYTYTGATPSADGTGWVNQGVVTRSNFEIELPSSTVPGSQVWFRCCYFSPRGECGPASDAVFTHVQFATSTLLQAA